MASDKASSRKRLPESYRQIAQIVDAVAPLEPQPWWLEAATEAEALFNRDLRFAAGCLALSSPRAIDYIRTAPVLVLAGAALISPESGGARHAVERMAEPVDAGAKLPVVMRAMDVAPQLRPLRASALHKSDWRTLILLGRLHPSTIAQIVPRTSTEQGVWLTRLQHWGGHALRRFSDDALQFEWAARHLAGARWQEADGMTEIIDLIGHEPARFNTRWTFGQALQSAARWHSDFKQGKHAEQFRARYKVDFEQHLDLAPFPAEYASEDLNFIALNSGKALAEEGQRMHHCVASYFPDVIGGKSRIYSLRRSQDRVATLELCARTASVLQLKGPCNAAVAPADRAIAVRFGRTVRSWLPSIDRRRKAV